MPNGDILLKRFPIEINPNAPIETATTVLGGGFTASFSPRLEFDVVENTDINKTGSNNFVFTVMSRATA